MHKSLTHTGLCYRLFLVCKNIGTHRDLSSFIYLWPGSSLKLARLIILLNIILKCVCLCLCMFVCMYVFLWRCKLLCTLRQWIFTTCARKPFLDAFNFLRDGSSMKAVENILKKHFVVALALFAKLNPFGPPEVGFHVNSFIWTNLKFKDYSMNMKELQHAFHNIKKVLGRCNCE